MLAPAPGAAFVPEQFGNYLLVEHLGRGGMADVYKARAQGIAGFARHVVVKRILRIYTEDPRFVDMFVNEAKIAARLSHPNIIHIYELGRVDGVLFIAMEYIRGHDLVALLRAVQERGMLPMPPLVCAYILREVLYGLAHAHAHVDEDGQPSPIIHRDVSPQNVMLKYDGQVKLVDFGIAKAVSALQEGTRTIFLKGKMGYMAPEQLRTGACTPQTDIFSVAVVLHELLSGQRLFKGQTDFETMTSVVTAPIPPPSRFSPAVPLELDRVVMRALSRDPYERYAQASHMARDLDLLLQEARFSVDQVVAWLRGVGPIGTQPGGEGGSGYVSESKDLGPLGQGRGRTGQEPRRALTRGTSPGALGGAGTGTGGSLLAGTGTGVRGALGGTGTGVRGPLGGPGSTAEGPGSGGGGLLAIGGLTAGGPGSGDGRTGASGAARDLPRPEGSAGASGSTISRLLSERLASIAALRAGVGRGAAGVELDPEQVQRRKMFTWFALGIVAAVALLWLGARLAMTRPQVARPPAADMGRAGPVIDPAIGKGVAPAGPPDMRPAQRAEAPPPTGPQVTVTNLQPRRLRLDSEPSGAAVYTGPRKLGKTPLDLSWPGKPLPLTLILPGWRDLQYTVAESDLPDVVLRLTRQGRPPRTEPLRPRGGRDTNKAPDRPPEETRGAPGTPPAPQPAPTTAPPTMGPPEPDDASPPDAGPTGPLASPPPPSPAR